MKLSCLLSTAILLAAAPAAVAQKWEIGGAVGGSFYNSQTVKSPAGNADANVASGFAGSAWLGNNSGPMLGGELRYDYGIGDLKLSSGGNSARFGAHTQAFHYDFLFHFAPRQARVRPFIAAGGGIKMYSGTGHEVTFQPLEDIALLTKTSQMLGLVSVGAGIKFAVTKGLQFRIEVHDYLTPFPKNVIAPAAGAKVGGWLQQFVPSVGIALVF